MSACSSAKLYTAVSEEFSLCLQRAYANTDRYSANDLLNRCLFLLERLPLTTTEYAAFRNRIRNAQRYSWLQEWGAARYELRLLQRSLSAVV